MFLAVLSLSWGQDLPILESKNRAKLQSLCNDVSVQAEGDTITISNIHYYYNTFLNQDAFIDKGFLLGCLSNSTTHTIEYISLHYTIEYQWPSGRGRGSQGGTTQLDFDPIEANSTQPFRLGAPNETITALITSDLEWEAENGETGIQSESLQLAISGQIIEGLDEEYCDQVEPEANENGQSLVVSKLAFYQYPIPFPHNPRSYVSEKVDSGYIVGCITNLSTDSFSGSIEGDYSTSYNQGFGNGFTDLKSASLLPKQTAPFFIDAVIRNDFVGFEFSPTDQTLIASISTSGLDSVSSTPKGDIPNTPSADSASSIPQEDTPNMSPAEQTFYEDTITYYDYLKTCTPHTFSYAHPLVAGFEGKNIIIGKKEDSCQVEFLMPGMKMLCDFSAESIATLTSEKNYQDARNGVMSSTRMNSDECEIF